MDVNASLAVTDTTATIVIAKADAVASFGAIANGGNTAVGYLTGVTDQEANVNFQTSALVNLAAFKSGIGAPFATVTASDASLSIAMARADFAKSFGTFPDGTATILLSTGTTGGLLAMSFNIPRAQAALGGSPAAATTTTTAPVTTTTAPAAATNAPATTGTTTTAAAATSTTGTDPVAEASIAALKAEVTTDEATAAALKAELTTDEAAIAAMQKTVANLGSPTTTVTVTSATKPVAVAAVTKAAVPAQVTAGMVLVLDDDFTAPAVDLDVWTEALKPDGTQWGGYAWFSCAANSPADWVSDAYVLEGGTVLNLRAKKYPAGPNSATARTNPMGWPQTWYSGMISTAKAKAAPGSVMIRRGVVEKRMKLPNAHGMWPSSFGSDDAVASLKAGITEIDLFEGYCANGVPVLQMTCTLWGPGTYSQCWLDLAGVDLSLDYHDFVWVLDDTHLTCFIDGRQAGQVTLQNTAMNPVYFMISNSITETQPTDLAAGTENDLRLDYVRIWSAD